MVQKTIITAMKMCAMEAQGEPVQPNMSLVIRSVIENILDKEASAGHIKSVAMRAVVHLSMVKALSDALLENNDRMAPIATFVPH